MKARTLDLEVAPAMDRRRCDWLALLQGRLARGRGGLLMDRC